MGAPEQYTRNVEASQAMVARTPAVVKDLLNHSNYVWAAQNCKQAADAHIDLGLLHWRRGIDPRADFDGAFRACSALDELVRKHDLPKSDFDLSPVYAAMFLMGQRAHIEYFSEEAFRASRWLCYQGRIVHALHDQVPDDDVLKLVDKHLAENDELPERIYEAYAQLFGLRPSKMDEEDRVMRAKSTWAERKRHELVPGGPPWDGHGVMNDLYVDIYLAAILKKIGWKGHTVHAWIWD